MNVILTSHISLCISMFALWSNVQIILNLISTMLEIGPILGTENYIDQLVELFKFDWSILFPSKIWK